MKAVIYNFDAAASSYDQAALMQVQVAENLVAWVKADKTDIHSVLDLGCGTGLVSLAAHRRWPNAEIVALDTSSAMVELARHKIPQVRTVVSDATSLFSAETYDLVLSSMMLHWLDDPLAVVRSWQRYVKPGGQLCVALLVEGSFEEWRTLCTEAKISDGLWTMPRGDFADIPATAKYRQALTMSYASAHEFLQCLKQTGAATPRQAHVPISPGAMRRILTGSPRPFDVTYQVLYVALESGQII